MRLFSFIIISICICLSSCKQTSATQQVESNSTTQTEPKLFVSMSKTPCYGRCPTYSMSIFDNGNIEYNGKRFVEKEGNYTGTLSMDQINMIKERINTSNFFELNSKYDSNVTDFPSCIIEVKLDGKSKKITDRIGAPKELKKLEKFIEEMVFNAELTKVKE